MTRLQALIALSCWLLLGLIVAQATGARGVRRWLHQLFIAADQLVNVLSTPFHSGCWADETWSARCYRAHQAGRLWGRLLMPPIDAVSAFGRGATTASGPTSPSASDCRRHRKRVNFV